MVIIAIIYGCVASFVSYYIVGNIIGFIIGGMERPDLWLLISAMIGCSTYLSVVIDAKSLEIIEKLKK